MRGTLQRFLTSTFTCDIQEYILLLLLNLVFVINDMIYPPIYFVHLLIGILNVK